MGYLDTRINFDKILDFLRTKNLVITKDKNSRKYIIECNKIYITLWKIEEPTIRDIAPLLDKLNKMLKISISKKDIEDYCLL